MDVSWALVSVLFVLAPCVSAQDAATHCFKNSQISAKVYLECPEAFTIVIQDAFYGSNSYRECTYTSDTCKQPLPDFNKSQCLGKRNCSIATRRMYSVTCGGYVDFFRVIYECYPVVVARTYTFPPTINTPDVPKRFGIDTPIRDSGNGSSEPSVGMILAVVGCVLGTLYISVVCIFLAVMFRRNDEKRSLAHDEERSTEIDNSGFKGSGHRLPTVPESSAENEHQVASEHQSTQNIVTSRPGPDGHEIEAQVFQDTETPVTRGNRERNHYNSNIKHGNSIAPKSLFVTKDIHSFQKSTNINAILNNSVESQTTNEKLLQDVSNC